MSFSLGKMNTSTEEQVYNPKWSDLQMQLDADDVYNKPPSYSDVGHSARDSHIQSQTDSFVNTNAPSYSDVGHAHITGHSYIQSRSESTDGLIDANAPSYSDVGHIPWDVQAYSQTDECVNTSAPSYGDVGHGTSDSHIQSQTDGFVDTNAPSHSDLANALRDMQMELHIQSQTDGHQRTAKRHRISDNPDRLNVVLDRHSLADIVDVGVVDKNDVFCKNSACRAKLSQDEAFCKRCSCCICYLYDFNRDTSLWLVCSSCGMSCHLECALKHEKSGLPNDGKNKGTDGSFWCVSCGELNDLLGYWRKQMTIARDTGRADIVLYRVSVCQKLLAGTLRYQKLQNLVNEAMEKCKYLDYELSSQQEVQKLCALALESLDSVLSNSTFNDPGISISHVRFTNIFSTSAFVVLGSRDQYVMDTNATTYRYIVWHRKAEDTDYPTKPTLTLFAPSSIKFLVTGLTPSTQYILKIVQFESTRELGSKEISFQTSNDDEKSPPTNSSSFSNHSPVEDENKNIVNKQKDKEVAIKNDTLDIIKKSSRNDVSNDKGSYPFATATCAGLSITPCKKESVKDANLTSKPPTKPSNKNVDNGSEKVSNDLDFAYYVKVIRWLECEGYIDTGFRKRFLTWYLLNASEQEVRIVKGFVDTLMKDPTSLAGLLLDTCPKVLINQTYKMSRTPNPSPFSFI